MRGTSWQASRFPVCSEPIRQFNYMSSTSQNWSNKKWKSKGCLVATHAGVGGKSCRRSRILPQACCYRFLLTRPLWCNFEDVYGIVWTRGTKKSHCRSSFFDGNFKNPRAHVFLEQSSFTEEPTAAKYSISAIAVKVHRIARGKMDGIAGSSNSKGTEKIQATGNMHAVKNAALVKLLLRRPAICFARFPW